MKQEAISKKKRIITMLIAVLFVIAAVFSAAFVIKEANHKCNHTDCQICQTMQLCIKNLTAVSYTHLTLPTNSLV